MDTQDLRLHLEDQHNYHPSDLGRARRELLESWHAADHLPGVADEIGHEH